MLTPTYDQGSAGLVRSPNRSLSRAPQRVSIGSVVALWTDLQMDLSGCGSQAGVLVRITYMNLYNPTLISPIVHWTKVLTPRLYCPRSAHSIPSRRIPKGREPFLIPRFSFFFLHHFRLFLVKRLKFLLLLMFFLVITISWELLSASDRTKTPEKTVMSPTRTPQPRSLSFRQQSSSPPAASPLPV